MATKIRLQRHGRKNYAFYKIVIADSRAPRDGRFIERIGSYNPNTNPASVDLNFERALYWMGVGAIPTDTVRNILSQEGVLMKKHLDGGVKKGAFDQATADKRFAEWLEKKNQKIETFVAKKQEKEAQELKARLDAEKAINQTKVAALEEKRLAEEKAKAEAEAAENASNEEAPVNEEEVPAAE